MAETTTKIGPIFRGANGGFSDDLFTGINNSYYYSVGMEILDNDQYICPKQSYWNGGKIDLGQYLSSNPLFIGKIMNTIILDRNELKIENFLVFGDKGILRVYRDDDTSNYVAVKLFTKENDEYIRDSEKFGGHIFFSSMSKLYDIAVSSLENATTELQASDFNIIQLNSSESHPLYATDIYLCVGNGNVMSYVDSATVSTTAVLSTGFTLQEDYTIKFIAELGGYVRSISDDGGYGYEIQLWNKAGGAPTEVIPLIGYKVIDAYIYEGYHFILTDKGLGIMNGYQFYILKKFDDREWGANGYFNYSGNPNSMFIYDDKLYIETQTAIYIYGAKNKNYTEVLNKRVNRPDDSGGFRPCVADQKFILVPVTKTDMADNKKHQYIYIHNPTYIYSSSDSYPIGELHTRAYYGDSLAEIKQALYLKLGFNIDNGYIKVYYRTDVDAKDSIANERAWHELTQGSGIRKNSAKTSPFSTTLKLNVRFQWIQFKFELKGKDVYRHIGSKTKLYSADLYYNTILS